MTLFINCQWRQPCRSLAVILLLLLGRTLCAAGDFNITDYGAKSDPQILNTAAIQKAIDACTAAGGGRVIVPAGDFRSAGVVLKDNVTLFLVAGAVLRGPTKLSDYSANKIFVSAEGASSIGLAGPGTIDGSGASYMIKDEKYDPKKWVGREWAFASHFAYKALPRPANVRFTSCTNVTVTSVTLTNAPSWTLHCMLCDNVVIDGITIRNPMHGVNNDGIDLNMCRDARVVNCDVSTGDDAICLKCNDAGKKRVSRNIFIANCRIETECQAFKIGTESMDGFENIVFRDSYIYNRSSDLSERATAGIAIETVDGGVVNGVTVSNIEMVNVRAPIFIRLGNRGNGQPEGNKKPGSLKNIVIENITARHSLMESSITGIPGHDVENVTLRNIEIELEGAGKK
ncbi:MAG: glycosyl hydrolase family 28 protein [Candidatus Sumerlaeota bacterium]|nr:glycosyl hydrolase family 28 protein [Candidatus Sumerlaeota bacterium]